MDCSNDIVLEFIELMSKEPILWNPKHKNHKNRSLVADAWGRIQKNLSEEYTIDVLKRKRNSLMTQYRDCLRKIRDSSRTANSAEEVHQPAWFAFDSLHDFLGEIYQSRPTFNNEIYLFSEDHEDHQYQKENTTDWLPIRENKIERESESSDHSETYLEELLSPPSPVPVKTHRSQITKKKLKRKLTHNDDKVAKSTSDEECDIYGQLLSTKLKKLDHEDRLRLMNDIDNLTYKHMMSVMSRNRPSSSTCVSSMK